jgi:hypothetical protein
LNLPDGSKLDGLKLYQKVKEYIKQKSNLPKWVEKIIEKINTLPMEAKSVLMVAEAEEVDSLRDTRPDRI